MDRQIIQRFSFSQSPRARHTQATAPVPLVYLIDSPGTVSRYLPYLRMRSQNNVNFIFENEQVENDAVFYIVGYYH
jgi:hypothetical protein